MAATWKKVIVSGSSAELANVNIDTALRVSGSVVVSTTAGAIVNQIGSTQATTFLSGSFTGSFTGTITGSLFGSASQATSASYAYTASSAVNASASLIAVSASYALTASYLSGYASGFPFTGSAQITGSLGITGSVSVSGSGGTTIFSSTADTLVITGSLLITGSGASITGSLNVSGAINAVLANVSQPNFVAYNTTTGLFTYANTGSFTATSASFATSASYAATASYAVQTIAALSQGAGITAFSYNGSSSVAISVSGAAALSTNSLPKWTGTAFANSNITDTGTAVSIASLVPVTINSNLTVQGDLTVVGTASFVNTENVLIGDKFLVLASGSTSLTDGGFIVATSTTANGISGSAFFIEAATTGLYGRFAVAPNVNASSSQVTADEYMNTTKISAASNPSNATPPTWGSTTNGVGNMWVNATTSDIYIWA